MAVLYFIGKDNDPTIEEYIKEKNVIMGKKLEILGSG